MATTDILRTGYDSEMAAIHQILLEPFDRRTTRLVETDGRLMHWVPDRDVYQICLSTTYWDRGRFLYTIEEMPARELHAADVASRNAYQRLISAKLRRLQMRHYFLLAHERGGYC